MAADVPPHLNQRIIRMKIASGTGWSLNYIDELSLQDVGDILAYLNFKESHSF